ncbi:UDP-N-acetylmuramoyl-tripeptide--D-alanyl-D-alanine ligase [Aliiglaciecola sp. 3_MG-2023]|uniref:UDP-N-acetylmuramoyl-tripeptide--D-alanyl-D- alanine ligase n=1 Tax=Aliiglaciecola sp. 3_MG-2023 TaxID=3062644 RepID=UPI0026E40548|nr:UDP-N-acetylmuramoyl-tripeptide--D-alanyl-D-alanine ligase [Aliiglaciecola sp. 3_MG-2023]MDO6692862.1 UDP-N-acetylmuramoyl-tripeptide--D-alanyl-D-alanine ligase [Aliiglaciecola sp. 3_MG-2023]
MIEVSLDWIAQQTNGELFGTNDKVTGVSTDTRSLGHGDVFIALVGPNFDGHKFVDQAANSGAAALIVSQEIETHLPYILVEDTKLALGALGAAVKQKVAPKTVGITGSSGKTTVKEMVAGILSRIGNVLATDGNFNNEIGVPLTLLRLQQDHDFAVIEMGANHLGEIAYTTNLVKPDVATIVNAAAAHLEGFGSLLGVARAKSEIFRSLSKEGTAIINKDSQFSDFWSGKLKECHIQGFSESKETEFYAQDISLGIDGCAQFMMCTPKGKIHLTLSLPGTHNVGNALAAAALAMNVGASLDDIKFGLQNMQQVSGRLQVKQLTNQVKILDDTYNANVASVNAAIDLLSSFSGYRILVLGDMGELGEKARYYHELVGEHAKQKGIDNLTTLGVLSQAASDIFGGKHFSDIGLLIEYISDHLASEQRDITILVKGSRSARMENVVKALEDSPVGKFERVRERIAC